MSDKRARQNMRRKTRRRRLEALGREQGEQIRNALNGPGQFMDRQAIDMARQFPNESGTHGQWVKRMAALRFLNTDNEAGLDALRQADPVGLEAALQWLHRQGLIKPREGDHE